MTGQRNRPESESPAQPRNPGRVTFEMPSADEENPLEGIGSESLSDEANEWAASRPTATGSWPVQPGFA